MPALPKTRAFLPEVATCDGGKNLAADLRLALVGIYQRNTRLPVTGVGLYDVKRLVAREPALIDIKAPGQVQLENFAMVGAYDVMSTKQWSIQSAEYVAGLVKDSGVGTYIQGHLDALNEHHVVAHLHYYPSRSKPDPGFHKDTRGQTLFFVIHYTQGKQVYGAEWIHDDGLSRCVPPLIDQGNPVEFGSLRASSSELKEVGAVWPMAIRQDVQDARAEIPDRTRRGGPDVLEVEPGGAALVVDELVFHRTPNQYSRALWPRMRENLPNQREAAQAMDRLGRNALWDIKSLVGHPTKKVDEQYGTSSSSRRMSIKREDKQDTVFGSTFAKEDRQFFRLWITVSPKSAPVKY